MLKPVRNFVVLRANHLLFEFVEERPDPLYRLLHDRPNPWTSSTSFIQDMEKDCVLEGRAYALANRVDGRIIELIKLDYASVTPDFDANQEPIYHVALKGGGRKAYGWQDILDVPTLGNLAGRSTSATCGCRCRPALLRTCGKW
jgi:phage portal protein BeeE